MYFRIKQQQRFICSFYFSNIILFKYINTIFLVYNFFYIKLEPLECFWPANVWFLTRLVEQIFKLVLGWFQFSAKIIIENQLLILIFWFCSWETIVSSIAASNATIVIYLRMKQEVAVGKSQSISAAKLNDCNWVLF